MGSFTFTKAFTTVLCPEVKSLDASGQWMWQLYSHSSSSFERNDFEVIELSTKFRAETRGDMKNLMACVGH